LSDVPSFIVTGDENAFFSRELLSLPAVEHIKRAIANARIGEPVVVSALCEMLPHLSKAPMPGGVDLLLPEGAKLSNDAPSSFVLIISAPVPAVSARYLSALCESHRSSGRDATIVLSRYDDSETVGACRAACINIGALKRAISENPSPDDATLKSVISSMTEHGANIGRANADDSSGLFDISLPFDFYKASRQLRFEINASYMMAGVEIEDPDNAYISPKCQIAAGVRILPNTILKGECRISRGAVIGPNAVLENAAVGEDTTVNASQITDSSIGNGCKIGPFAYIRPGCAVSDMVRVGDFVELKNSQIGQGTKIAHLTYIGDSTVGENVNFGCGTVTVNYNGEGKYQTVIEDGAFIGCNTNLIAPIKVGRGAYTAAGSTVTEDVPAGALAIARSRQENKVNWPGVKKPENK